MRTISGSLLVAQTASTRTPFIKMLFTSKDGLTTRDLSTNSAAYGNRILMIDHVEEAYNEYATVLLRNSDKGVPNVLGYWTQIGYGDGSEYAGDGVNGDSIASSRLWVKSQQTVLAGGRLYTILELEGMWARLRETLILLGTTPYYSTTYSATHVYDILEALIETEMNWILSALGSQDDSIIDTLAIDFDINQSGNIYEYMAGVIYKLLRNTKCHLRARAGANPTFEVRYPQAADTVDLIIYSGWRTYTSFDDTTPAGNRVSTASGRWRAQTFTPSVTHMCAGVRIRVAKFGTPGTVTVSLKATDGDGKPTGADLASATFNGDDLIAIPPTSNSELKDIPFATPVQLTASTLYAIVVRSAADRVDWQFDASGDAAYGDGDLWLSTDSGSTWSSPDNGDAYFEEYGWSVQFYEYTNRNVVHIPNRIYVFANQDADGLWTAIVNGDEADSGSVNAYAEIASILLAPSIATAGNADLLAAAVLSKIKAESVVGVGLIPHHCAIEVLDKIQFVDTRGGSSNTYPSDGTVRVGGLRHIYKPGYYRLQITLGGVSVGGEMARAAAGEIVFTEPEAPPPALPFTPKKPFTPERTQVTLKPTQGVWREVTIRPATEEERQYYAVQGFLRRIGRWLWGSRE